MHFEDLGRALRGTGAQLWINEPMSRHTTFRVGGRAALFVRPQTREQAAAVHAVLRESGAPRYVLGRGSNLLAEDCDLPLAAVQFSDSFSGVERLGETLLYARAGTPLTDLCRAARDASLSGLEFAYGIPGTVGGGVYMNAGAYGGELADAIVRVDFLDPEGRPHSMDRRELNFSYRHSPFTGSGCWILGAAFALKAGAREEISAAMEELLARRREKQPLEYPSAGSTFKRPAGAYAAELIDRCGLKGFSVGGAQVSEKHAGFVINRGGASCADILQLISEVQRIVLEKTGFELEREVRILGPDGER